MWDAPIPTLVLVNRMSPALGLVFSVVIFVDIYTSAAPQLWRGVKLSSGGLTRNRLVYIAGVSSAV